MSYASAITLHVGVLVGATWYMSMHSEQTTAPDRPSVTVSFKGLSGEVVAMSAENSENLNPADFSQPFFPEIDLSQESTVTPVPSKTIINNEDRVDDEKGLKTVEEPSQKIAKVVGPQKVLPTPVVEKKKSPKQQVKSSQKQEPVPKQQVAIAPKLPTQEEVTALVGSSQSIDGEKHNRNETKLIPAGFIHLPDPVYPRMSRRRAQEGTVRLSVTIDTQGKASAISVLESSGHTRLDESAIKALAKAKFYPAKKGEQLITTTKKVSIRFDLDE